MDKWDEEMYHQKCTCGHELYLHAFVDSGMGNKETMALRTSQCTSCGYDYETKRFLCEGFVESNE